MLDRFRILVTNDDGIEADGLIAVALALRKAGLAPIVVAPDGNRSGCARDATFSRAVSVECRGELEGVPLFACDGSPVDCVRVALLGDLASDAALVLSGINHGANLGDDTLISGRSARRWRGRCSACLRCPCRFSVPSDTSTFSTLRRRSRFPTQMQLSSLSSSAPRFSPLDRPNALCSTSTYRLPLSPRSRA